jgi:hypothetical protein
MTDSTIQETMEPHIQPLGRIHGSSSNHISQVPLEHIFSTIPRANERKRVVVFSGITDEPNAGQQQGFAIPDSLHLFPVICFCLLCLFIRQVLPILFNLPVNTGDFHIHRRCHHPVYLSTLTLIKNEADYLLEWIEYHLLVGVERFFLVDNDSHDNTTRVIEPYIALDLVRLRTYAGLHPQLAVYNMVLPTLRNETYWVAVIDIDEFIVPLEFHCIPPILHSLEREVGIYLHWVVYSSNGKQRKEEGLVIERFRAHATWNHPQHRFGKLISRPTEIIMAHVHGSRYRSGSAVKLCPGKYAHHLLRNPPCYKRMRINHYWTKSREEWARKVDRGQVFRTTKYNISLFTMIDDVVANDSVMDWYIPRVKANLARRNSYPPCNLVSDPQYNDNIQFADQSANPRGASSRITVIIQHQKEKNSSR